MLLRLTCVYRPLQPIRQVASAIPAMAFCVSEANGMDLLMAGNRGGCGKASGGNQVIEGDAVLGHLRLHPKNRSSTLP